MAKLYHEQLAGRRASLPPDGTLVSFDDEGISEEVSDATFEASITIPGYAPAPDIEALEASEDAMFEAADVPPPARPGRGKKAAAPTPEAPVVDPVVDQTHDPTPEAEPAAASPLEPSADSAAATTAAAAPAAIPFAANGSTPSPYDTLLAMTAEARADVAKADGIDLSGATTPDEEVVAILTASGYTGDALKPSQQIVTEAPTA